ncbi:MAG: hypothetical protein IPL61_08080 [Myxococcales bacterium]|nr:hypothetical protein [Myxococcales bacterium]
MTRLQFLIEWEEAPGVRSPVVAATWARLEIRLDGRPITQFWSESANAVRTGVYGSIFPLARWLTTNWWHLTSEGLPTLEVMRGGRRAPARARAWVGRHCFVYARDGMAYPDLSFYREDEDRVGVRWVADPSTVTTAGRFLGDGVAQLNRRDVEVALASVIESVIERTTAIEHEDLTELRSDWRAIGSADGDERTLCERLATLGQDPYAPDLDEHVEFLLANPIDLTEPVLRDVLAATDATRLGGALAAAHTLVARLPLATRSHHPPFDPVYDARPYVAGYRRADAFRRQFAIDPTQPLRDLDAAIERAIGVIDQQWVSIDETGIEGAIQRNGTCAIAAAGRAVPSSRRFLLARALHHWTCVTTEHSSRRLLTRATDWQQAASRAFAAELLAPAAALTARMRDHGAWDLIELADEFQVNPMVIARQIENHGLG